MQIKGDWTFKNAVEIDEFAGRTIPGKYSTVLILCNNKRGNQYIVKAKFSWVKQSCQTANLT